MQWCVTLRPTNPFCFILFEQHSSIVIWLQWYCGLLHIIQCYCRILSEKIFDITFQRFTFHVNLSFHTLDTFKQFKRFGASRYRSTLSSSSAGKSFKKSLNNKSGSFCCNRHLCSGPHTSNNTSIILSTSLVDKRLISFTSLKWNNFVMWAYLKLRTT